MLSCRELVEDAMSDPNLIAGHTKHTWQVRLHLLICRHCRRFTRQLRLVVALLARLPAAPINSDVTERIWRSVQERHTPDS